MEFAGLVRRDFERLLKERGPPPFDEAELQRELAWQLPDAGRVDAG